MKKLSILIIIFGLLAAVCLIAGAASNLTIIFPLLLIMVIVQSVFRNKSSFWLPTICFSIYSAIAIWTILEQSILFLAMSGELLAFTAWELLGFRKALLGDLHSPAINQLINQHLRTIIPVILIAWIISLIFLNIQIKLPFLVILLAAVLGIFGFFRFYRAANQP